MADPSEIHGIEVRECCCSYKKEKKIKELKPFIMMKVIFNLLAPFLGAYSIISVDR